MLSRVRLFATPWTVARQAPLSKAFPRQECWSGLPFLSPRSLPDPAKGSVSPALAGGFFTTEPPVKLRRTGTVIANLQIKTLGLWRVHECPRGWKASRQPRQDAKPGLSGCRAKLITGANKAQPGGQIWTHLFFFFLNLFIFN